VQLSLTISQNVNASAHIKHAVRDGFTHGPNRPWPRVSRFWGPRATIFSMTTQC